MSLDQDMQNILPSEEIFASYTKDQFNIDSTFRYRVFRLKKVRK